MFWDVELIPFNKNGGKKEIKRLYFPNTHCLLLKLLLKKKQKQQAILFTGKKMLHLLDHMWHRDFRVFFKHYSH